MKHKNKILFGAILSTFILLTTPVFANVTHNTLSTNKELIENISEHEQLIGITENITQLLFKTITDIAQNKDFNKMIGKNGINYKIKNNDFNTIYLKLLIEKPRIIFSLLRIKPTISEYYLRHLYDQGLEIIKILDESEIKSIMKTININDENINEEMKKNLMSIPELRSNFEELNNINCNNDNLYHFDEISPLISDYPIVCTALFMLYLPLIIYCIIIQILTFYLIKPPVIYIISEVIRMYASYPLICKWAW